MESSEVDLPQPPDGDIELRQILAAIVDSSDDAIVSKDLSGIITSWNKGAERLFGYTSGEIIGRPITLLIPEDRQAEEPEILARLRRGERIDHYETVRRRKDGSLVDISISVSPIKAANGVVIGASKIARDITDRRRATEQMNLMLQEMQHRTKNLAVVLEAIARQSAPRGQPAVDAFLEAFLGRVHALLSTGELVVGSSLRQADLRSVLTKVLEPFAPGGVDSRIRIEGPPLLVSERAAGGLALAAHELATNALKYGALMSVSGKVSISWTVQSNADGDQVCIDWKEAGAEAVVSKPGRTGFGSRLIKSAVAGEPGGATELAFEEDGLHCRFRFTVVR